MKEECKISVAFERIIYWIIVSLAYPAMPETFSWRVHKSGFLSLLVFFQLVLI